MNQQISRAFCLSSTEPPSSVHLNFYRNFPKFLDRQAWANSENQYQTLYSVASDHGLQCLPHQTMFWPVNCMEMYDDEDDDEDDDDDDNEDDDDE